MGGWDIDLVGGVSGRGFSSLLLLENKLYIELIDVTEYKSENHY
jgi:hypothetical protein